MNSTQLREFAGALRPAEQVKLDCGRTHFKALATDIRFRVSNNDGAFEGTIDDDERHGITATGNLASAGKEVE